MKYVWSDHAASERLPERTGLLQSQIELRLDQRRYVINREYIGIEQEHHLIWDENRRQLIDVPIEVAAHGEAYIPTILPIQPHGNRYAAWQRAEAERAWRGEGFYREPKRNVTELWLAHVFILKWRTLPSDPLSEWILTWPLTDSEMSRTGDAGMLELFRDLKFCRFVKNILQKTENDKGRVAEFVKTRVKIEKPGAHREIPFAFFLSTP